MATTRIASYVVQIRAGDKSAATRTATTLYDTLQNTIGILAFVELDPVPPGSTSGLAVGYYPVALYADVIDLLRNERPVYLVHDDVSHEISVSTSDEPAGEGEPLPVVLKRG